MGRKKNRKIRTCRCSTYSVEWRVFRNGTAHLVKWCRKHQQQAFPNPLPASDARLYDLPSRETVEARWIIEHEGEK